MKSSNLDPDPKHTSQVVFGRFTLSFLNSVPRVNYVENCGLCLKAKSIVETSTNIGNKKGRSAVLIMPDACFCASATDICREVWRSEDQQ